MLHSRPLTMMKTFCNNELNTYLSGVLICNVIEFEWSLILAAEYNLLGRSDSETTITILRRSDTHIDLYAITFGLWFHIWRHLPLYFDFKLYFITISVQAEIEKSSNLHVWKHKIFRQDNEVTMIGGREILKHAHIWDLK